MNLCSYNIRGLNNKISFVRDFISNKKIGLISLLETHVKKDSANFVSNSVSPRFTWLFNYDCHSNGRIWVGWDPGVWKIQLLKHGSQHISCSATTIGSNDHFFVSFIYAMNTPEERRELWSDLLNFRDSISSNGITPTWILLGDFNVCLNANEINGGSSRFTTGMQDFKDFLQDSITTDLRLSGNVYTWWDCNKSRPIQKKLDRALVNGDWLVSFPMAHARILPRGLSDHCPVLVELGTAFDKLNKPFQVFDHIIANANFISTVSSAWSDSVLGNPWSVLLSKLKRVKSGLINLNKEVGNLHEAVLKARTDLSQFQENLPLVPSLPQFEEEAILSSNLIEALNREEIFLKQKARVKWLKAGDSNNKFFFNSCRGRWNVNKLLMLEDDTGATYNTHKDISTHAVTYFKSLLGTDTTVFPIDDNVTLPHITTDQVSMLDEDFTAEEILCTFKLMAKGKSSGPDGFSPEFFIAAWDVIGADVVKAILYFFESGHLPRGVTSVAIALVPKTLNASTLPQFRPISCCNTLYKCIAKLLASRLKRTLPALISANQSAFVPHRSIGDNIMLAQALCRDYHKNEGAPRCALKLDIHKAFDTLNWSFLFAAMERMGFPIRFTRWIRTCITNCMISLKINGSIEGFFPSKTGLRQGDPLSAYLFVIGMEVFSAYLLHDLQHDSSFSYHWRTKDISLSHLIFADDLFLFCKGNMDSIIVIHRTVSRFSKASGLYPNLEKSEFFFSNVPEDVIHDALETTGYQQGFLPIKYLGLPLITKQITAHDCVNLVQRLCLQIDLWTTRFLRFSGRLQLIKSVLVGIQGFWSTYLFLPKNVLMKIKSYFAKFLWGGKSDAKCQHKVAWSDCCLPKLEGGLGISDLQERNKAGIMFQIWKLSHPRSTSLWHMWFHRCLLKNKAFWTSSIPSKSSWAIRQIMNLREEARRFISINIGVNSDVSMWHDPWIQSKPIIHHLGHSIISISESTSSARVKLFISDGRWVPPSSNHVLAIELRHLISSIHIYNEDSILWHGSKDVNMASIWHSIRSRGLQPPWATAIWHTFHIPKCAFFMWLALKARLLTRDRMISFGMHTSPICVLCNCNDETAEHLFTTCPYTRLVLHNSPVDISSTWSDWQIGVFTLRNMSNLRKHISWLFISILIYSIWQERNNRIHGGKARPTIQLIIHIKNMLREKLFTCAGFKKNVSRVPSLIPLLY